VDGEVNGLYSAIDRADAAPTAAQLKAIAHVGEELPGALKRWEQIKSADLPALNRQLRDANLPEVRPEPKLSTEESQNEE
jgi:hypothetical protein